MQSVFSVAARRKGALEEVDFGGRAGALKTPCIMPRFS
jgi:cytochrome c biogenesis protein CcdA